MQTRAFTHNPVKLSSTVMALGSIFMCVSTAARADYIPPCSPSDSNVRVLPFPGGIPTSLLKLLTEHVGDIVSPGEKFDATDIRVTGRNRRMIFVWNRGVRYVLATEHGGIGYSDPIFVYEFDRRKGTAGLVSEKISFPNTVCEIARGLITAE
jgi:hypothetical protein